MMPVYKSGAKRGQRMESYKMSKGLRKYKPKSKKTSAGGGVIGDGAAAGGGG